MNTSNAGCKELPLLNSFPFRFNFINVCYRIVEQEKNGLKIQIFFFKKHRKIDLGGRSNDLGVGQTA